MVSAHPASAIPAFPNPARCAWSFWCRGPYPWKKAHSRKLAVSAHSACPPPLGLAGLSPAQIQHFGQTAKRGGVWNCSLPVVRYRCRCLLPIVPLDWTGLVSRGSSSFVFAVVSIVLLLVIDGVLVFFYFPIWWCPFLPLNIQPRPAPALSTAW